MSAYFASSRGLASRMLPRGALSPLAQELFGAYEPGAMYDPEITGTLFQDSAGTTPVTAVEQPVGLMLDKSGRGNHATQATTTKRPVLSARYGLIAGTEMTGGAGGEPGTAPDQWQLHVMNGMNGTYAHTIENGKHRFTASGGRSTVRAPMTWLPGVTYVINLDLINNQSDTAVSSVVYAGLQSGTGVSLTSYVDGVVSSIIPPGMHTIKIVCSFTGGTPLPNIYVGAGAAGMDTADITALKCSVALATDAHLPYQRVNTNTNYDADPSKFPAYLRFDGVDDALQTGNIDFTGTDKMTVWAGLIVSSSSDQSGIFELGVNSTTSNGLSMQCMVSPFTTLRGQAFGTSRGVVDASGFALNTPYQVCAQYDLSAALVKDEIRLRKNGAYASSPTLESSGTGNFSSYPLTIMARGYMNAYTGGRLYSLIVRGAQTPLSQIEATELYIKQKMRLP